MEAHRAGPAYRLFLGSWSAFGLLAMRVEGGVRRDPSRCVRRDGLGHSDSHIVGNLRHGKRGIHCGFTAMIALTLAYFGSTETCALRSILGASRIFPNLGLAIKTFDGCR